MCRYVRYYADTVQHGLPKIKTLQLRQITISGLSPHDLDELVVTVRLRAPGVGWDTELVCLAAAQPHKHFFHGTTSQPD